MQSGENRQGDLQPENNRLLCLLKSVAIGLAVLYGAPAPRRAPGQVVVVLPWLMPTVHSFLLLAALSVAFLSLGRYHVRRELAPLWTGLVFTAFALLTFLHLLAWPGLLPGERSLFGQIPNAAAWLGNLALTALVALPLAAAGAPEWRIGPARGHHWRWLVVAEVVTEIRRLEQVRDEFLAAAAHELRTPVTAIRGYVQLLRGRAPGDQEPHRSQAMAMIEAQCNRLSRRVGEIQEVVRLRTAPFELRGKQYDLGELAAHALQRVQATTQLHRLLLKRERPVLVRARGDRIAAVLEALLDNAIKYSPEGGDVEVRLWTEAGEAIVAVTDRGVGIAPERQPHIFEPFYEPVPSGAPGYRSEIVLGLYLSRLWVERYGGHIWLESAEGKGSTFYFSLPAAEEGAGESWSAA